MQIIRDEANRIISMLVSYVDSSPTWDAHLRLRSTNDMLSVQKELVCGSRPV